MAKRPMKQWAHQRMEFQGWWTPKEGDVLTAMMIQRARPSGRFKQAHYVVKLAEATAIKPFGKEEAEQMPAGTVVAIPDAYGLDGLEELAGYEVEITCKEVREFDAGYGELRTVRVYTVLHSEEPVNAEIAKTYGPKTSA